jgi:hypothetical protein
MLSPTLGLVAGQNSIFQPTVGATVDAECTGRSALLFNGNEGNCDALFFFDSLNGVTTGVIFRRHRRESRAPSTAVWYWNSTLFSQGMQGIDFPKPETGFAVGFVGTILRSTDLGIYPVAANRWHFADLFDVHFASDGLTGVAVGASGTILRTANAARPAA